MNDIAIKAERLAKKYVINVGDAASETLSEGVTSALSRLLRSIRRSTTSATHREEIWPLKSASFEIRRGEVVGVIGRNGAGKSTLLKILSRITEPTSGRAEIYGRVGTLLEVGTGFHPELSGRDNIYLSGIILGMNKSDIDKKFDEIVEFAGISRFVDTPVKRYSSGMYVRLAFAVGAHLEPEVLIVDEVLAVGDLQFQQKCLDKMHQIGDQGRTVIFVSHNMQAVSRLCRRVLLLDKGELAADGSAQDVVSKYLHGGSGSGCLREWNDPAKAPGDETARLLAVRVKNALGETTSAIDISQEILLEMEFEVLRPGWVLTPAVVLTNGEGLDLFETFDLDPAWRHQSRPAGQYVSTVRIPGNFLTEGSFFVSPACFSVTPSHVQFYEREAVAFQIIDRMDGNSMRGDHPGEMLGVIRPQLQWGTRFSSR
ncbi:ABC transporter [Nitrospira sp. KM1]|uniref:ABC transporter ATP-binding protein n=1 Tax=Nitrospira sp. KM1 TaxID=1936990 RepID=UPI0013A74DAB|nr:ABC transporter ATP-binding protein [Nitrospira sp. KM1]BCA54141.1 ABC transporter [Nitrospira sp. KM1]